MYPEVVRREDKLTVLTGLMRFLRRHGYWPKRIELCDLLKAPNGPVADVTQDLIASGHVDRLHWKAGSHRLQLTTRGWHLLGVEPIEPWRRPPARTLLARVANMAAERLRHEEELRETGT